MLHMHLLHPFCLCVLVLCWFSHMTSCTAALIASTMCMYLQVANKRNGIDVDKFDYLLRDSKMCGVTVPLDPQRIMMYSRLDKHKEQVRNTLLLKSLLLGGGVHAVLSSAAVISCTSCCITCQPLCTTSSCLYWTGSQKHKSDWHNSISQEIDISMTDSTCCCCAAGGVQDD